MKFDLEKAKAGDPVLVMDGYWKHPAHFIGLSVDGLPVVQRNNGIEGYSVPYKCHLDVLSMAPKKVTVRYRVGAFRSLAGKIHLMVEQQPGAYEHMDNFKGWVTDWQTAEVEE